MSTITPLGIDISKNSFDVYLLKKMTLNCGEDIEAHLAFLQQQKESLKKRMDEQVEKDENLPPKKSCSPLWAHLLRRMPLFSLAIKTFCA
ncbi:MAG: hypothetical protein AAGA60_32415 [Cyanobacteria bacterium P01_E01_bin.42]